MLWKDFLKSHSGYDFVNWNFCLCFSGVIVDNLKLTSNERVYHVNVFGGVLWAFRGQNIFFGKFILCPFKWGIAFWTMVNYCGDVVFLKCAVKFAVCAHVINELRRLYTLRVHWLRTSLELTPIRTVTCVTLRIINDRGRVSEFVYFSLSIFFF